MNAYTIVNELTYCNMNQDRGKHVQKVAGDLGFDVLKIDNEGHPSFVVNPKDHTSKVVLTAHYTAKPLSCYYTAAAANHNASGTGIVLDTLTRLTNYPVSAVLSNGGGSEIWTHYSSQPTTVIAVDMCGSGEVCFSNVHGRVAQIFFDVADRLSVPYHLDQEFPCADHAVQIPEGIESFTLFRSNVDYLTRCNGHRPVYDSGRDTMEWVHEETLDETVQLLTQGIKSILSTLSTDFSTRN